MSEWGHCQGCGCSVSGQSRCDRCAADPDGKCDECGCAFEYDFDTCLDHLESTEDLRKYALGLVECLNKLGEANTILSKKNLDLSNKFYTLLERVRGHNVSNQIANVQMAGFLAKFKEDGE